MRKTNKLVLTDAERHLINQALSRERLFHTTSIHRLERSRDDRFTYAKLRGIEEAAKVYGMGDSDGFYRWVGQLEREKREHEEAVCNLDLLAEKINAEA